MAGGNRDSPSPTTMEDRVLAHVREGLTDAEIAVRLGASVSTVRYHLNNLRARSGATSRDELKRWRPKRTRRPRSRAVPVRMSLRRWAIAAGVVVALAAAAFLLIPTGGSDEVASAPPSLPAPYSRPDAESLRAEGYVPAGPLLAADVEGDIVLGHSPRALFTPVLLSAETEWLNPRGGTLARLDFTGSYASASGVLETDAGEFTIRAEALGSRGREPLPVVGMATRPVVRAWAQRPGAADIYRATFTSDGHAWVHPEPLDPNAVYDNWTGEHLDLDGATLLGLLPDSTAAQSDFSFTTCSDGPCVVSYRRLSGPIPAPLPATVTCESLRTVRLDAGDYVLRFSWANTGFGANPSFDCDPVTLRPGDQLAPPSHYVITAYDREGRQVSAGITPSGSLYAGDFRPTVACPCRQGS